MVDVLLELPGPEPRTVKLSSPDKVLWPDAPGGAVTKRGLADYLIAVSEPFLRLNGDRPMTLQRFPDGVDGEEFFSKRPPRGAPSFLRTVTCTYPSRRRHDQLVFDEPAALAWAAQMGTITFHPWPVRTSNLDNPDEFRIDLDPQPGRDFRDAVHARRCIAFLQKHLERAVDDGAPLFLAGPRRAAFRFLRALHRCCAYQNVHHHFSSCSFSYTYRCNPPAVSIPKRLDIPRHRRQASGMTARPDP